MFFSAERPHGRDRGPDVAVPEGAGVSGQGGVGGAEGDEDGRGPGAAAAAAAAAAAGGPGGGPAAVGRRLLQGTEDQGGTGAQAGAARGKGRPTKDTLKFGNDLGCLFHHYVS